MAFPDALVVLSTRPAEAWSRSAASTIFQLGEDPTSIDVWRERFGFDRYDDRFDDPEAKIAAREALCRRPILRSPNRLLEWTFADGWAPPATV